MSDQNPISYIERTRAYYLALGYDNPYEWAAFDAPAFTKLKKPLHEMKIGLVVTAAPYKEGAGEQGPGAAYNGSAKFFDVWAMPTEPMPHLYISHIAIDRDHTTAEDQGTYFPLKALQVHLAEGKIGGIAQHIYGFPTNRSQRTNIEKDAPALTQMMIEDDCDAAVLVPNCPVCHQSVAIAARHLEDNGIPTVIMGAAKDIVMHARVPRLLFSDFPLGNSAGKPHDQSSQYETMKLALDLLVGAERAETVWDNPQIWSEDHSWKEDYSNPDKLSAQEIARRRAAFDAAKTDAQKLKRSE